MNTSTVELNSLSDSSFIKSFKNIISRIGKGYTYKETQSSAGYQLQAISSVKSSNLPNIRLILNILGDITTIRFEATGNLSHYVIEEVMLKVFPNLNPIEIELTELETGRIRINLNKKKYPSKKLYPVFKREFFSYYANDEGRLLILLDDEPDPTSSIAVSADPLKIRPRTTSYTTRPPQISSSKGRTKFFSSKHEPENDLSMTDIEASTSQDLDNKVRVVPDIEKSTKNSLKKGMVTKTNLPEEEELKIVTRGRKKKKKRFIAPKEVPTEKEMEVRVEEDHIIQPVEPESKDLSKNEKIILDLIDTKPKKKVQSKGLKKELSSLEQVEIKDILRSLVNKGFLYVEAAWYLRKQPDEVIEKKSEVPLSERLKRLSAKEKKVFDILNRREGNKAQARMLIKPTKMSKDNLKKILRDMVAKDVLFVEAAWYIVKSD